MSNPFVVLVTGSRWKAYPPEPIRRRFDDIQNVIVVERKLQVVLRVGRCKTGVDNIAETLALAAGWDVDPMPANWRRCSPICPDDGGRHRRPNKTGPGDYCPVAGCWRNQQMIDKQPTPNICYAFPMHWSSGTWDCYSRALKAGIETHPISQWGERMSAKELAEGQRKWREGLSTNSLTTSTEVSPMKPSPSQLTE